MLDHDHNRVELTGTVIRPAAFLGSRGSRSLITEAWLQTTVELPDGKAAAVNHRIRGFNQYAFALDRAADTEGVRLRVAGTLLIRRVVANEVAQAYGISGAMTDLSYVAVDEVEALPPAGAGTITE